MDDLAFEAHDEPLEYLVELDVSSKLDGFVERGELSSPRPASASRPFARTGSSSRVQDLASNRLFFLSYSRSFHVGE